MADAVQRQNLIRKLMRVQSWPATPTETIPNKPIIAGKTHSPDVIVRDATLGELALGRK